MVKRITVFDTSVCSSNIGDCIIMDSVMRELDLIFSEAMMFRSCTQEKVGLATYRLLLNSDLAFVGGTNLLSSRMNFYSQWKVNLVNCLYLNRLVLMGVGWWQYQKETNFYTKALLKKILHDSLLHSVRDSYTEERLSRIGIKNVINTGCPTMWNLTGEHCSRIPRQQGDAVVFTLTDYNPAPDHDRQLIRLLNELYDRVFFWPQGIKDMEYYKSLGSFSGVSLVTSLSGFDRLLDDRSLNLDYVGTRLHAGIRALQKHRRSIIISIDNRAVEKAKDFNLLTVARGDLQSLGNLIESAFATEIKMPFDNIAAWRDQFSVGTKYGRSEPSLIETVAAPALRRCRMWIAGRKA